MTQSDQELIRRTVAATLRKVAEWVGQSPSGTRERDQAELRDMADQVDVLDRDYACCPLASVRDDWASPTPRMITP